MARNGLSGTSIGPCREARRGCGLGLKPEFLDEDATNGELHPEGVTLLGRREVEVCFIGASGDEEDPPLRVRETLDEEHLARFVSSLEETSYRNTLLDRDDTVAPDAQRDTYFERVRLGLTDEADGRPGAASDYAYRGMRERYGMVRARDSILPFDLVLQGSSTFGGARDVSVSVEGCTTRQRVGDRAT